MLVYPPFLPLSVGCCIHCVNVDLKWENSNQSIWKWIVWRMTSILTPSPFSPPLWLLVSFRNLREKDCPRIVFCLIFKEMKKSSVLLCGLFFDVLSFNQIKRLIKNMMCYVFTKFVGPTHFFYQFQYSKEVLASLEIYNIFCHRFIRIFQLWS